MEVIALQVFVSLTLVLSSILLYAWSAKQRTHEHGDRLSLLPLTDDSAPLEDRTEHGQPAPRSEVSQHG